MIEKNRDDLKDEPADNGAEGVGGATAGVAGGGVIGGVLGLAAAGPVGMLIGTGVGSLVGGAAGYAVDYDFDKHSDEFREHHAAQHAGAPHTWDQASPAYRYGWESFDRPEFRDRTYDHARTDLHKGWTGSGDFADFEGYVRHGWERRSVRMQDGSKAQPAKE